MSFTSTFKSFRNNLLDKKFDLQLLEIEPTLGCNLRCSMCHVPRMKEKVQFLDLEKLKISTKGLENIHVIIGSEFEPTLHPKFQDLLKLCIERNWKVDFLTNGTNLHKYDEKIFSDVNFNVFNISFDGSTKISFENSRLGANYERVLENTLKFSEKARTNGAYTAINATIMSSNYRQTPFLVEFWDNHKFDLVRLCIVQARSVDTETLDQTLVKNIGELSKVFDRVAETISRKNLNIGVRCGYYSSDQFNKPKNIEIKQGTIYSSKANYRHVPGVRQDFQNGYQNGMQWPCKSPFVYARIRWDGEVDLCNKRDFSIGNIYSNTFNQIWENDAANSIRERIKSNISICESCDYYRFCLNARDLDINDPKSHLAQGVFDSQITKEWLNKQK